MKAWTYIFLLLLSYDSLGQGTIISADSVKRLTYRDTIDYTRFCHSRVILFLDPSRYEYEVKHLTRKGGPCLDGKRIVVANNLYLISKRNNIERFKVLYKKYWRYNIRSEEQRINLFPNYRKYESFNRKFTALGVLELTYLPDCGYAIGSEYREGSFTTKRGTHNYIYWKDTVMINQVRKPNEIKE